MVNSIRQKKCTKQKIFLRESSWQSQRLSEMPAYSKAMARKIRNKAKKNDVQFQPPEVTGEKRRAKIVSW